MANAIARVSPARLKERKEREKIPSERKKERVLMNF